MSVSTWSQALSVFAPSKYVQPQQAIDDAQLNFLAWYLSFTSKCFGDIATGREAKRLHFITPVLVCVCFLLQGDVKIVAEEDFVGKFVKTHGHFKFMLKQGTKAVCIVEAKKDDIDQGMAQDLVGCKVAAEVGGVGCCLWNCDKLCSVEFFAVAMIKWRWTNACFIFCPWLIKLGFVSVGSTPPNNIHLWTCRQCRPDTLATFC